MPRAVHIQFRLYPLANCASRRNLNIPRSVAAMRSHNHAPIDRISGASSVASLPLPCRCLVMVKLSAEIASAPKVVEFVAIRGRSERSDVPLRGGVRRQTI